MTEEPSVQDDDYLVRVKAQVMVRDDSTGGWVPLGRGGMSLVGLRRQVLAASLSSELHHEYLIYGRRISDKSVVLNCTLRKDVQYTKANPTFHHWQTEQKRFGLTFQSSADARAFDKGIKRAVDDLLEGSPDSHLNGLEVGEDDVFMSIELPLQRTDSPSHSASTVSTTTSSPSAPSPSSALPPLIRGPPQPLCGTGYTHPHANHHHLHRMHYLTRPDASSAAPAPPDVWVLGPRKSGGKPASGGGGGGGAVDLADYSYVQFAKDRPSVHEYSTLDRPADGKGMTAAVAAAAAAAARRDSVGSLKRHHVDTALLGSAQPALPTQSKGRRPAGRHRLSRRSRCMYCREMFVHDENARGSCADAPDRGADCVRRLACLCAADSVLYHCTADADGEYADPCTCDRRDDGNWTRWLALTALSVFVPCLLCYWPLTACYRCAVACHCCGGRHKAT